MTRVRLLALVGAVALVATCGLVIVGNPGPASAATPLDPSVKPNGTLSVANPKWSVTGGTPPKVGDGFFYQPHDCRGKAQVGETPDSYGAPAVCDAYRVAIDLDTNKKAANSVYFELDYDETTTPGLDVVALGLNPLPAVGGLQMHVWDTDDHYLGQNATTDPSDEDPGGDSQYAPQLGGFFAKQKLYDITVEGFAGPAGPYTLRMRYSNELFTPPKEVLDDTLTGSPTTPEAPPTTPPDLSGATDTTPTTLPPAVVLPDKDIAGVGVGVDQQFNAQQAFNLHNTRSVSAVAKPPAGWLLWLNLVLLPSILAGGIFFVFRRRRAAFIS